jgi:hypothetical protein
MEVACPAGTQLRIESLVMSHSWPTVNAKNDKLYLKEIPDSGGQSYNRIVVIRPGIYNKGTLVAGLQAELRDGTTIADGVWSVNHEDNNIVFSNSSPTAHAVIYSRADLRSQNAILLGTGATSNDWETIWADGTVVEALPIGDLDDCCELIGLLNSRIQLAPLEKGICTHIDLQRHKALYLCSETLPSNSLDLRGRNDIIKQIVVGNSAPGTVLVDALPTMANFSHFVAFSVLKHISFTIRGHDGRVADLYDHQVSFIIELIRPADM